MTRRVCGVVGCPNLADRSFCDSHEPTSARNHRGVPRQARGLGVEHDRATRALAVADVRCELRLPGCTGRATSPEHRIPRSRGGSSTPDGAACLHCQNAQGAALMRAG